MHLQSLGRGVMLWMAAATAVDAFAMSGPSVLARRVPAAPQFCRAGPLAAAKAPLNSETLSIAVGSFSLASLLINRLATEQLANAQGRSDLLGVAICSALLLTAFSTIDLKVREKEQVELAGVAFDEVLVDMSVEQQKILRWATGAISQVCSNAKSVAVYSRCAVNLDKNMGTTVARLGIMGRQQTVEVGPIVKGAMTTGQQQFLADLQILPGRFEFSYLPINTQAILVQPLGAESVIVIGANKVRPFTGRDLVMMKRVALVLARALDLQ